MYYLRWSYFFSVGDFDGVMNSARIINGSSRPEVFYKRVVL